jgi:anti-sigma factor RsiW
VSVSAGDPSAHLGDVLSALLDDELSPTEAAAAREHLGRCRSCASELDQVRTARAWVRGLPAVDPPFGFLERLVLGERRAGRGGRRFGAVPMRRGVAIGALAASAAAAVGLLGLAPPRESPVSPSVARLVEAHATGASLEGDPLSRLAPLGVPVSFRR